MADHGAMRVSRLWRYPVKSMGGEQLDALEFAAGGVRGDRVWSLYDVERRVTVSARRLPAVLMLHARFAAGDDGPVVVTLPDGTELHSSDADVHARVSETLDRDVRLVPLPSDRASFRLPWRERLTAFTPAAIARDFGITAGERLPDPSRMKVREVLTLTRYATPPGSFVDLGPVHLVTEASLRAVGSALTGAPLDARRFRPNVLLAAESDELVEAGWTDAIVRLGSDVRITVSMPTVRCVVPSRAQPGVPLEPRVTRAVASVAGRYLGVYGDVAGTGTVRVGDEVQVSLPGSPGAVRTVAAAGRTAALRSIVRVAGLARR